MTVRVLPFSASPPLPPPAHFRHWAPRTCGARSTPPTLRPPPENLYTQPRPGISRRSLTCGQSRAESCLLRPRRGVTDKAAAATPQARRAALDTRDSPASASLMQASAAGGVTPDRIPGLPVVTVQSEIGGPEILDSAMGLQTPAELIHFPKVQASGW